MEPVAVKVGDLEVTLRPVGITQAISLAIPTDDPRMADPAFGLALGAAALRACWPDEVAWPARRRPRPLKLGQDVGEYGRAVLDELYPAAGMPLGELAAVLHQARAWAVSSSITEAEVQNAADFSDGPEAAGP
jgi:hypothetical protein